MKHPKIEPAPREIPALENGEDYFVIRWKPVSKRPANCSYALLKERDEELGVLCSFVSYEDGQFWYFGGDADTPVDESRILGWDYLPYDHHLNEP